MNSECPRQSNAYCAENLGNTSQGYFFHSCVHSLTEQVLIGFSLDARHHFRTRNTAKSMSLLLAQEVYRGETSRKAIVSDVSAGT